MKAFWKRLPRPLKVLLDLLLVLLLLAVLYLARSGSLLRFSAGGALKQLCREELYGPAELVGRWEDGDYRRVTLLTRKEEEYGLVILYYEKLPLGLRVYDSGIFWRLIPEGEWGVCGISYPEFTPEGLKSVWPVYIPAEAGEVRARLQLRLWEEEGDWQRSYAAEAVTEYDCMFRFPIYPVSDRDETENRALNRFCNGIGAGFEGEGILKTYDEGGKLLREERFSVLGGQ